MLHDILFAIWFMLPAAFANATPIFCKHLPGLKRWNARIDGGRTFRGKDLLGAHKTWRGLVCGMIVSTIIFALQQYAVDHFAWARYITEGSSYDELAVWLIGPLLGFGAIAGDAIESFFKRQRNIPSGSSWVPFDQIDYIIGAALVTLPFIILSPMQYVWMFILWFGLHIASTFVGWKLGLKKDPI
jgi:CDP-2,3-bis-(O-geranylgeranyl)-sn-glycerol synthase